MKGAKQTGRFGFGERERRALRYCTYCPKMCRFACPVAHGESRETVTPWGLMRLLNLVEQGHLTPEPWVLETLEHCVSCGRCTTFCKHENPVAETLAHGRAKLVASGLEMPEAWQVPEGGCQTEVPLPAYLPDREDLPVFLPSCAHLSSSEGAERLLAGLSALAEAALPLSVPGMDPFVGCGFHAWEVGLAQAAEASWKRFAGLGRGRPACITDCAPSLWALGVEHPEEEGHVIHLAEWLSDHLDELPARKLDGVVVLHDACFVTRRLKLGGTVRAVVAGVIGRAPRPLHEAEEQARCCGSSGHWAEVRPDAHERSTAAVVDDIADAQADIVVTASPSCRNALERQVRKAGLSGPGGKPVEVVDLLGLLVS